MTERRVDPLTGAPTWVVGSRQDRPNLPESGCPFCVGGVEAPMPYDVRSFPNRWPSLPDDRCEVVLYTSEHELAFWQLPVAQARRVVDLWAERSAALGGRSDVAYVLVFENRGTEVGATIAHPHGQIYAFADVPPAPLAELRAGEVLDAAPERLVTAAGGWQAWVPHASPYPYAVRLAPEGDVPDLPSLNASGRDDLAFILIDVLQRLDRLFAVPLPYMLWIHQRPFDGGEWPRARVHVEIVSPWRASGVMRYVAAGELGSGVFFNPIVPEDAAARLRELG